MCFDPISMAIIGAGVSAAGQLASGAMQSASYKAQARYADRQAIMSQQKGDYDARQLGRQHDRALGEMRSQYLGSGIALGGSTLDVLEDSATQASLDEQAIKYSAQVQSDNYRFQAGLARSNASSAMTGGYMGALATGINSFTSIRNANAQRTMISNPYTQYDLAKRGSISGMF